MPTFKIELTQFDPTLVVYIENYLFDSINNEIILQYFQMMKSRREQLSINEYFINITIYIYFNLNFIYIILIMAR